MTGKPPSPFAAARRASQDLRAATYDAKALELTPQNAVSQIRFWRYIWRRCGAMQQRAQIRLLELQQQQLRQQVSDRLLGCAPK